MLEALNTRTWGTVFGEIDALHPDWFIICDPDDLDWLALADEESKRENTPVYESDDQEDPWTQEDSWQETSLETSLAQDEALTPGYLDFLIFGEEAEEEVFPKTSFTREDVVEIIAMLDGDCSTQPAKPHQRAWWYGVFRLVDGRFAFIEGEATTINCHHNPPCVYEHYPPRDDDDPNALVYVATSVKKLFDTLVDPAKGEFREEDARNVMHRLFGFM